MKLLRWLIGTIILLFIIGIIIYKPFAVLFYPDLPFIGLFKRSLLILLLCVIFCIYRVFRGPTPADRIVAIDILGILVVGVCAILGIPTGRSWYIDIGIAWALQSFIGTIALAKYLEGRDFDE